MRSLQNAASRGAMEYYFGHCPPGLERPEWSLDRLFVWLHAVLVYVVREEQSRASYRREVPVDDDCPVEPADPAAGHLDALIQQELQGIVAECFPMLGRQHRRVLRMRVDGMKYDEIARRLGVNENTVATWVSRGIRDLGQRVRRRMERR